jgi:hypothetical protein
MSRIIRCRRCGARFVPDRSAISVRWRRLCPRCRGPLPPSGGVPAVEGGLYWPHSAEVVA